MKSVKSMLTSPSFSLSLSLPAFVLFKSEISLLISSLAGSNPSALSATFKSLTLIFPYKLLRRITRASCVKKVESFLDLFGLFKSEFLFELEFAVCFLFRCG